MISNSLDRDIAIKYIEQGRLKLSIRSQIKIINTLEKAIKLSKRFKTLEQRKEVER